MGNLKTVKNLSLTMDFWSSFINIDSESFLGVTCSYIDNTMKKKDICLNCKHFTAVHTAKEIAEFVCNFLLCNL